MSWNIDAHFGSVFFSRKTPFQETYYPPSISALLSYQEWQTICQHLNGLVANAGLLKWNVIYWISFCALFFIWIPLTNWDTFFIYFWVYIIAVVVLQMIAVFAYRAAIQRLSRKIEEYCLELSSVYANRGLHFHFSFHWRRGVLHIDHSYGYQQAAPVYQAVPMPQNYTNQGVASPPLYSPYNVPQAELAPPSYNQVMPQDNYKQHYNV